MKTLLINIVLVVAIFHSSFSQAPDTMWTKIISNGGGSCTSVKQTIDRGYVLAGNNFPQPDEYRWWMIKTDSSGHILWSNIGGWGRCYSIETTSEDNYIFVGEQDHGIFLLCTSSEGNTLWTKSYGDGDGIHGNFIEKTNDDGFIILGLKWIASQDAIFLFKINSVGDTLWTKTYGGAYHYSICKTIEVHQTSDDGYIIGGYSDQNGLAWIIKTDSIGDTLWTRKFYGININSIAQTMDDGFIITGEKDGKIKLLKTNALGIITWQKTIGGSTNTSAAFCIQQLEDQTFILAGTSSNAITENDVYVIKTDSQGEKIWDKRIHLGLDDGYPEEAMYINQTTDGGYIVTGSYYRGRCGLIGDLWLIKLSPDSPTEMDENVFFSDFSLHQNYPNPFNPTTTLQYQIPELRFVTLKIYDVLGNEIETLINEEKQADSYEINWNAKNLPSGVYFYRLQAGSFVETKKMVLLK